MAAKSYWTPVACDSEGNKRAISSWFSPLCNGMEPIKADILCDIETDREKKIRVLMRQPDGTERLAIRSKRKGGFTITLERRSTPKER